MKKAMGGRALPLFLTCFMCLSLIPPAAARAAPGYADVPRGAWYAGAAEYCETTGLMKGTGNNRFSPDGTVSRAMLAAVLYRLAGSPPVPAAGGAFADVPAGAWYAGAVAWASRDGCMGGYGGGLFGPDAPATREQMVTAFWRYMGSPAAESPDFADKSEISPYAATAVDWARSVGLINGLDDGRFAPKDGARRSQLAMMLMNFAGLDGITTVSAMDIMCQPNGSAVMEDGSLLVTDTYHQVIWRVKDGMSTVYAGGSTVEDLYGQPLGGYNDAPLKDSYFKTPWAIAPFLDGWAVSDADNDVVRLLRPEDTETVNGHTSENLTVTELGVAFQHPTGLASDGAGNLYIADTYADAVRKITAEGEVTTVASGLSEPTGMCWHDGVLYIAESGANRVVKLENGKISVVAGSGEADYIDGPADRAAFSSPQGVAVGSDGTVYVSDTDNSAIRKIKDGQVSTLVARDVTDLRSFFPITPTGLLVTGNRLYICDPFARKLLAFPLH